MNEAKRLGLNPASQTTDFGRMHGGRHALLRVKASLKTQMTSKHAMHDKSSNEAFKFLYPFVILFSF